MAQLLQKKSQRAKKETTAAEMREKIRKSKSMVVTDYRGLSMVQLQELRSNLGESAEYMVTKNTVFARTLNEEGMENVIADDFFGPSAVLFCYDDEVAPLKILTKFAAGASDLPKIKRGVLGDSLLSAERVIMLSKLPSKDQLRGQVVSGMVAPLTGLVSVLNGNVRNLVYALNQIKEQKAAA